MLHNVGGGVNLGCGPICAKQGQKILVPGLSENEAKNYYMLHASFITSEIVHD